MLPHVFCRIVYNGHTRIIEGGADFFYKNRIDFKNNKPSLRVYPIEDKSGDHSIAGSQFYYRFGLQWVNFIGYGPTQKA